MDVSKIRAEAAASRDTYAILVGDWSPFWHDAIDLMGMENLMGMETSRSRRVLCYEGLNCVWVGVGLVQAS
jgi:hypothetical protein